MDNFKCPHCGGEVPEGMRFCPHCMTSLEQKQTVSTSEKGSNKKTALVILGAALCAAVVAAICIFPFKGKENSPESQSEAVSTQAATDNTSTTSANTTTIKTSAAETESSTVSTQAATQDTTTTSVSSQHSETLPSELPAENLAAKIKQWCTAHSPKYFGISGAQDITAQQNTDGTTFSFIDKSGARINIGTDKNGTVSLYFRIGHVSYEGNDPHVSEILSALGEILFGVDLSGKSGIFSENGYSFEIQSRSIPELAYTEYYVTASRS